MEYRMEPSAGNVRGMIGGIVIETLVYAQVCTLAEDASFAGERPIVWINCAGTGCEEGLECAIEVLGDAAARSVSEGDTIWWQGKTAYWTPGSRSFREYPLTKLGYSGAPRPDTDEANAAEEVLGGVTS